MKPNAYALLVAIAALAVCSCGGATAAPVFDASSSEPQDTSANDGAQPQDAAGAEDSAVGFGVHDATNDVPALFFPPINIACSGEAPTCDAGPCPCTLDEATTRPLDGSGAFGYAKCQNFDESHLVAIYPDNSTNLRLTCFYRASGTYLTPGDGPLVAILSSPLSELPEQCPANVSVSCIGPSDFPDAGPCISYPCQPHPLPLASDL